MTKREDAMMVREITVELGLRSYTVFVGQGIIEEAESFFPEEPRERIAIVTDENVGSLYAGPLAERLGRAEPRVELFEVPPGEGSKTIAVAAEIIEFLVEAGMTRADLLVALGGGVVGDLTGFVASVYKRGIDLVQVPTTLMAQVDSSVGGKTAVNLPRAKNMVGTFYQPAAVITDIGVLGTLAPRQFKSGLAEIAKYSFIGADRWDLSAHSLVEGLRQMDLDLLVRVIADCVSIKAGFVSEDEYDTGARMFLNYGHTLGHALEAVTGYSDEYTHGEAISVGMVYAALVAEELNVAGPGLAGSHYELLGLLNLPTRPLSPEPGFSTLMDAITQDKKSRGDIAMVLLAGDGRPVIRTGIEEEALGRCYEKLLEGV